MKLAVFLIGLCMVLMSGADRVLAGAHSKGCCYTRTYHHEMMPEGKKGSSPSEIAAFKHAGISVESNFFSIDGLDEEEADETFGRRSRLAGKPYDLLSFQSILSQLDKLFTTPSSTLPHESDKYIFQRVFRV